MRPAILTVTGSPGASSVYPVDIHREGGIALGVKVTGTITFTVQHTFDDVFAKGFDPSTATWYNHPTLAGDSANEDSNYAYLPRGIRLTTSAGTGSASLTIIQMGLV
jgi:hypothetical protein